MNVNWNSTRVIRQFVLDQIKAGRKEFSHEEVYLLFLQKIPSNVAFRTCEKYLESEVKRKNKSSRYIDIHDVSTVKATGADRELRKAIRSMIDNHTKDNTQELEVIDKKGKRYYRILDPKITDERLHKHRLKAQERATVKFYGLDKMMWESFKKTISQKELYRKVCDKIPDEIACSRLAGNKRQSDNPENRAERGKKLMMGQVIGQWKKKGKIIKSIINGDKKITKVKDK